MQPRVETFLDSLDGGTGGVAVDRGGNVHVADFGARLSDRETMGRKIFRISPDGRVDVFAIGFEGASGNAFDAEGNLLQSSIRGSFVSRVAPDGSHSVVAREGIDGPVGIAIDEQGILYVANCGGQSVQRVTPDGKSTTFARSRLFRCPNGITLDGEHNLYVANFYNGDVLKIDPGGQVSRLATLPGANNGHVTFHDEALYVVARKDHRIYRVSLKGEVELFAGTGERGHRDGPALEATFSYPNDIAIAPDGHAFYIDEIASTTADETDLSPMTVRRIRLTDS